MGSEGTDLVSLAKKEPSLIDGLSYPLSVMYGLQTLGLGPDSSYCPLMSAESGDWPVLTIVVAGAAERAEERVLDETTYFGELALRYHRRCKLRLWMTGL